MGYFCLSRGILHPNKRRLPFKGLNFLARKEFVDNRKKPLPPIIRKINRQRLHISSRYQLLGNKGITWRRECKRQLTCMSRKYYHKRGGGAPTIEKGCILAPELVSSSTSHPPPRRFGRADERPVLRLRSNDKYQQRKNDEKTVDKSPFLTYHPR